MLTGFSFQNLRFVSLRFLTYALLGYFFLAITTLHHAFSLTANLPLENVLVMLVLFLGTLVFLLSSNTQQRQFLPYVLVSLPMIVSPLLSSLYNSEWLGVFYDPEYRTMVKMLVVAPWLFFIMQEPKVASFVTSFIVASFTLLGLYFLYRFLILQEVREFDLRPLINIRHGDPNFLATFFVVMLPLSLSQAIHYYDKGRRSLLLVFGSCTLLLALSLVLTQSRMAMIALFLITIFLFIKNLKFLSKKTVIFLALIIIGAGFSARETLERFKNIVDKSNIDRVSTLVNGLNVFTERPILGKGMHQSQKYFYQNTQYPNFQSDVQPLDIHNSFLKALAELGVLGLCSYLLLFIFPFKNILNMRNQKDSPYIQACLAALLLCLMSVGATYKDLVILILFVVSFIPLISINQDTL